MDCLRVFEILSSFIKSEVEKYAKGVVIGESGGIDSALCTVLSALSIGVDNVYTILMPIGEPNEHYHDALDFVVNNNIHHAIIPIDKIYDAYYETGVLYHDISKENTMARIRTNILRAYANDHNYLVLGTSNASEVHTGHFTKGGGDGDSDIAPLYNLTKGRVYQLVKYINEYSVRFNIPEKIIIKKPTPDLRPNTCDEDFIGPYKYVDEMVDRTVWGTKSIIVPDEYEKKFMELYTNSFHKRIGVKRPDIPYIYLK